MNEKVKLVLVISAKHAVNALLTNVGLTVMFHSAFHFNNLHDWTGLAAYLKAAVSVIASREAMVWGPKLLKWSTTNLDINGGATAMKTLFLFVAVLVLAVTPLAAQVTPPAPTDPGPNFYGIGPAYSAGADVPVAGMITVGHQLTDKTWAISMITGVPVDTVTAAGKKTFSFSTVNTNVGAGVMQELATIGQVKVMCSAAAGISWNGGATGWSPQGVCSGVIRWKKTNYYLAPGFGFTKSSVNGGAGFQPTIGFQLVYRP